MRGFLFLRQDGGAVMRIFKWVARVGGIVLTSLALARLWMVYPDAFPSLPESWWQALDAWYGARNAEEIADLEFLTVFSLSLFLISFLAGLLLFIMRRCQRSAMSDSA